MFDLFPQDKDFFRLMTVDKKTPFAIAVEYDHYRVPKESSESSNEPSLTDHSIRALVPAAIRHRNIEVLNQLIAEKEMLNDIIQMACRQPNGHELITDSRMKDVFTRKNMSKVITTDGYTPIMVAVKYGQVRCVEVLLKNGHCDETTFKMTTIDSERSLLHICAEYPNERITSLLFEEKKLIGLGLTLADVMGDTPLHICARKNNKYMCQRLLGTPEQSSGKPAMLQCRNNNGFNALHEAIENGNDEIVKLMIEKMAMSFSQKQLLEECDNKARTSLHIAALKGKSRIRLF